MKVWTEMATDILVAVLGAAYTGGIPFIIVTDNGIGFGIDYDTAPQSPGISLN